MRRVRVTPLTKAHLATILTAKMRREQKKLGAASNPFVLYVLYVPYVLLAAMPAKFAKKITNHIPITTYEHSPNFSSHTQSNLFQPSRVIFMAPANVKKTQFHLNIVTSEPAPIVTHI
jgi:hypothetical protein